MIAVAESGPPLAMSHYGKRQSPFQAPKPVVPRCQESRAICQRVVLPHRSRPLAPAVPYFNASAMYKLFTIIYPTL